MFEDTEKLVQALLYEGYLLFPYQTDSLKNRHRWTFGCLLPPGYRAVQRGDEPSFLHVDALVRTASSDCLHGALRFLHALHHGDTVERHVQLAPQRFLRGAVVTRFCFSPPPPGRALQGYVRCTLHPLRDSYWRVSIRVTNVSGGTPTCRDDALRQALITAHVLLHVEQGAFVSLVDVPADCRDLASLCHHEGLWPVLAGTPKTLIASPIILGDYPQIAPESIGDFYDGTEIDTMLLLHIQALTLDERQAMRDADPRTRALLERADLAVSTHPLSGRLRRLGEADAKE